MKIKNYCLISETICFPLLVAYRILLDFTYVKILSPTFAYAGFVNNATVGNGILSWTVFLMSLILWRNILINDRKISYEILFVLYLISFIPFTMLIAFGLFGDIYIIANFLYWCVLMFCVQIPVKRKIVFGFHLKNKNDIGKERAFLLSVLVFVILIISYVSGRYGSFRLSQSLFDIYEIREMAQNAGVSRLGNYLFGWTQVLLPLLISLYLKKKQFFFVALCMFFSILSFGFDGSKTAFFLVYLSFLINLLPNMHLIFLNVTFITFLIMGIVLGLLETVYFDTFYIISYFVRRSLCVPERLRSNYFDFFTHHTPDYFKSSFLRYFGFKSEYENIPRLISAVYSNGSQANANNGLISDAITNLGYIGILIMPIILAIVLRILDCVTEKMYYTIYLSLGIGIAFNLSNSFFFTVMLSHGLIILLYVLYRLKIYGKKRRYTDENMSCNRCS